MADHIPFVHTDKDAALVASIYPDSAYVRLTMDTINKTAGVIPKGPRRWVDASVDGLHRWPVGDAFSSYITTVAGYESVGDPAAHQKPDRKKVQTFVFGVLHGCKRYDPEWISVPQLPRVDNASRNRVNRLLAESTAEWRSAGKFGGRFVLPVIFTNQRQILHKTERNKHVGQTTSCLTASGATAVWVVDSTLSDQDGSRTFEQGRFKALLDFHEELLEALPPNTQLIAGPYWGMNLVLWAKRMINFPAIGIGNAYQYHVAGGVVKSGSARVALAPLRRWASVSHKLHAWLNTAAGSLSDEDPARNFFVALERVFSRLPQQGRIQIAKFYKQWFNTLEVVAPEGRALALYQDLSKAYVLGKNLPELPKEEGSARRPEIVAKQLMLHAL